MKLKGKSNLTRARIDQPQHEFRNLTGKEKDLLAQRLSFAPSVQHIYAGVLLRKEFGDQISNLFQIIDLNLLDIIHIHKGYFYYLMQGQIEGMLLTAPRYDKNCEKILHLKAGDSMVSKEGLQYNDIRLIADQISQLVRCQLQAFQKLSKQILSRQESMIHQMLKLVYPRIFPYVLEIYDNTKLQIYHNKQLIIEKKQCPSRLALLLRGEVLIFKNDVHPEFSLAPPSIFCQQKILILNQYEQQLQYRVTCKEEAVILWIDHNVILRHKLSKKILRIIEQISTPKESLFQKVQLKKIVFSYPKKKIKTRNFKARRFKINTQGLLGLIRMSQSRKIMYNKQLQKRKQELLKGFIKKQPILQTSRQSMSNLRKSIQLSQQQQIEEIPQSISGFHSSFKTKRIARREEQSSKRIKKQQMNPSKEEIPFLQLNLRLRKKYKNSQPRCIFREIDYDHLYL